MTLLEMYKIDLEVYNNELREKKRDYIRFQIISYDRFIQDLIDNFNKKYSEEELLKMENPKEMTPSLKNKIEEKDKMSESITREINKIYFRVLEELSKEKQKLNSNNLVGENK